LNFYVLNWWKNYKVTKQLVLNCITFKLTAVVTQMMVFWLRDISFSQRYGWGFRSCGIWHGVARRLWRYDTKWCLHLHV